MSAPKYQRFKHPIGANKEINIAASGNLLSLLAATGPIEVAMGEGAFIPLEVGQTVSFQDEEFDNVRILDRSGAINTVDVYVGRGEFFDMRFSAQGEIKTVERQPDTFATGSPVLVSDQAVTLVSPQNPNRRELILVNGHTAAVYVVGDSGAAAEHGLPLLAGQSITLETTAPVFVRNDTGAAAKIHVAELERSA